MTFNLIVFLFHFALWYCGIAIATCAVILGLMIYNRGSR